MCRDAARICEDAEVNREGLVQSSRGVTRRETVFIQLKVSTLHFSLSGNTELAAGLSLIGSILLDQTGPLRQMVSKALT